jgi:hypothetical protein
MFSLDEHPDPPVLPRFSRDMENLLVAAVTANPARRQSRVRTYIAVGMATAAIAVGAAVGIEQATHTEHPSTTSSPPSQQPGGANLAAFTVTTNPDGTVTLSLAQDQIFDPATLRQALANAGVAAIVTVGKVCYLAHPPRTYNGSPAQVLRSAQVDGRTVTTITPSAMPGGTELSIGYFAVSGGGGVHIVLVPDNAPLTCTTSPPPAPHH